MIAENGNLVGERTVHPILMIKKAFHLNYRNEELVKFLRRFVQRFWRPRKKKEKMLFDGQRLDICDKPDQPT